MKITRIMLITHQSVFRRKLEGETAGQTHISLARWSRFQYVKCSRQVWRRSDQSKMKTPVILLVCICNALAITVPYEREGSNSPKEYKTALKDIRLVPINQTGESREDLGRYQNPKGEPKSRRQNLPKYRGDKKKFTSIARVGNNQNVQNDPTHQIYMQKMANQLYMAQRHASLLSDYQKFIINQDPDVRSFVLAQSIQERNPKPFSQQRQNGGRALSAAPKVKNVSQEPVTAANADYKKIVVVTPKVQTTVRKISQPQTDYSAQATHVKYVTLAPQPLTHFVEAQRSPKVTLVPYHTPQPYTYLGVTHTPQVEAVHIPTVAPIVGSYEVPKYYKEEDGHEDGSHHGDSNYEFMYNVKDHEKHSHFGHKESRTDKTTYGFYFVHLPDGRLETVKYWADKTGYHAKVDYQGEAKHPIHTENKLHSHNLINH